MKSINTQLLLAVFLSLALAVGLLVFYVSTSTYQMALRLERSTLKETAESSSRVLENYLDNAAALTQSLSVQSPMQSALQSEYFIKDAAKVTEDFLKGYQGLWAIELYNLDGVAVVGANAEGKDLGGLSRPDATYLAEVLQGGGLTMADQVEALDDGGAGLALSFAAPVQDLMGRLAGCVAVHLRFDAFTAKFLSPVAIGKTGFIFLLDQEGRYLCHPKDPSLVLQQPKDKAFLTKSLSTDSGFIEDDRQLMAVSTVPGTGFRLFVSSDKAELAETPAQLRTMLLLAGLVLVLGLSVILALLVRRLVIKPLKAIEAHSDRIAAGDYSHRLEGRFRYELQRLSDNLQHMVEELKTRLSFSQGVLNTLSDSFPFLILDKNGRITQTNELLLRILNKTGQPEQYANQTSGQLFFGEPGRKTRSNTVLDENRKVQGEMRIPMEDGRDRVLDVNANPMYDFDGHMSGVLTLYFDQTTVREQEQEILAKNQTIANAARQAHAIAAEVTQDMNQLANLARETSDGSALQEQRAAETASAMEEMNASVMEVARNASETSGGADKAREMATLGAETVSKVIEAIAEVNHKAQGLQSTMDQLGVQAQGIDRIITTIEDIADQTNLLALNAAIEAARAGDAGRGFAVVADEVRKLAEKTMSATREVSQSISLIQEGAKASIAAAQDVGTIVARTTDMAGESGESLRQIVAIVQGTAEQIQSIAASSEQQSATSEAINNAVEEINSISNRTNDGMLRAGEAIERLGQKIDDLRRVIEDMQRH